MATIVFNGKTYNSLEEMPANERQAFEQLTSMLVDKNGNGIPDFLEGDIVANVMTAVTSNINYNGQVYNGMDELPPDVREKIQGAFEKLAQMGIATPDSVMAQQRVFTQVGREPMRSTEPRISREYSPTIQEDSGSGLKWVLLGAATFICLAVTAGAVLLLLQR